MHEAALRKVLLIRAIDEGDRTGEVLSLAERAEATRSAADATAMITPAELTQPELSASAERLLLRRAELLSNRLEVRSPAIVRSLRLADNAAWASGALLGAAFACGLGLSALDGEQHIEIMAFPLLGLIAWNLVMYVILIALALRPRSERAGHESWLSRIYARIVRQRANALLRSSSRFNVPLAEALRRFAREWAVVARPLLVLRAQRLFHTGSALVALGLIAGLYVRGLMLRFDAGWDSTFLEPNDVRIFLRVIYGPAASLAGMQLPDLARVEQLRWRGGEGGESAAPWIHLSALTALLYIIVPRLVAALVSSVKLWVYRRNPQLPAEFLVYARALLRETGRVSALRGAIVTYAYTPTSEALSGLGVWLSEALGADVTLEVRHSVAYGEEDSFVAGLRAAPLAPADCSVLLMNLSGTPEAENHGAVIAAMQSVHPSALLVIDASAYAARVRDDASLTPRYAERERAWLEFAAQRGQAACVVDLGRLRAGVEPSRELVERARAAFLPSVST